MHRIVWSRILLLSPFSFTYHHPSLVLVIFQWLQLFHLIVFLLNLPGKIPTLDGFNGVFIPRLMSTSGGKKFTLQISDTLVMSGNVTALIWVLSAAHVALPQSLRHCHVTLAHLTSNPFYFTSLNKLSFLPPNLLTSLYPIVSFLFFCFSKRGVPLPLWS